MPNLQMPAPGTPASGGVDYTPLFRRIMRAVVMALASLYSGCRLLSYREYVRIRVVYTVWVRGL